MVLQEFSSMFFIIVIALCTYCPPDSGLMQDGVRTWCYWFVTDNVNAETMILQCNQTGGRIFTVEDSTVQTFLESTLSRELEIKGLNSIWINHNISTGSTFEGVRHNYTNWSGIPGVRGCVGIAVGVYIYTWQDMSCTANTNYGVCYKPVDCPPNSTVFLEHGICFWYTTLRKIAVEAHLDCMADGGGLAIIPSEEISNALMMSSEVWQYAVHTYGEGWNMWLGVNDVCSEGMYKTFEGEHITYTGWALNQPGDETRTTDQQVYDCTVFRIRSSDIQWYDKRCWHPKRIALCSKTLTSSRPPTLNINCSLSSTPTSNDSGTKISSTANVITTPTETTTRLTSTTNSSVNMISNSTNVITTPTEATTSPAFTSKASVTMISSTTNVITTQTETNSRLTSTTSASLTTISSSTNIITTPTETTSSPALTTNAPATTISSTTYVITASTEPTTYPLTTAVSGTSTTTIAESTHEAMVTTATGPPIITTLYPMTSVITTKDAIQTVSQKALCFCRSTCYPANVTVNQLVESIKEEMLIDSKNTSSYRRSLVCADDPQPSARYIGTTAVTVMVTLGCCFILPDAVNILRAVVQLCKRTT